MPVLDPVTPPNGLAIASSAVLFALLDSILAKGVLDRQEIQSVLKTAMICVGARANSPHGSEAIDVMTALYNHFSERKL